MTGPSINRQRRVVLTGGIGSGKSTVAARLGELGAEVIEADVIGHRVLEPGGAAYDAVADRWPEVVDAGEIVRARLASIVFSDPAALRELEQITHPAIAAEIQNRVESSDAAVVVVEVPVASALPPGDWLRVVVAAPLETRIRRAVVRGGNEGDVRRRAAAQLDDAAWEDGADIVVPNRGSLPELIENVDVLWARLAD